MTKYILKAEKHEYSSDWDIVWYSDDNGEIWEETIEVKEEENEN